MSRQKPKHNVEHNDGDNARNNHHHYTRDIGDVVGPHTHIIPKNIGKPVGVVIGVDGKNQQSDNADSYRQENYQAKMIDDSKQVIAFLSKAEDRAMCSFLLTILCAAASFTLLPLFIIVYMILPIMNAIIRNKHKLANIAFSIPGLMVFLTTIRSTLSLLVLCLMLPTLSFENGIEWHEWTHLPMAAALTVFIAMFSAWSDLITQDLADFQSFGAFLRAATSFFNSNLKERNHE